MKLRKLALITSVVALSSPLLVHAGNTDADKKARAGVSASTPAGKAGADATVDRKGAAASTSAKTDGKRSAVGATGGAGAGATSGADKTKDSIR